VTRQGWVRTLAFVGVACLALADAAGPASAASVPTVTVDPTSGYPGTIVVVHGRGFGTTASRLFFCPPRIEFRDAANNATTIGTFGADPDFDVSTSIPEGAKVGQATITASRYRWFYHPPWPPRCIVTQQASTTFDVLSGPHFSIGDVSLAEGDAGTTAFVFPVTLSKALASTATVQVQTADGTANAGTDYEAVSAPLTFDPGTTQQSVSVLVKGDTDPELDETFTVHLSAPTNAGIGHGSGTGTILNDELPAMSIDDASAKETDIGTFAMTFGVTLSGPQSAPVSVDYHTVDGTATSPGDFRATSGMLTFAPGAVTGEIVVQGKGDLLAEPTQTFRVVLSSPSGATIADHTGVGTIFDDGDRCTAVGTAGGDRLTGTAGDDVLCGLGGPDVLRGMGGDDVLIGGWGHDTLVGGAGRDLLAGGLGADTLRGVDGVAGNDTLQGGNGTDVCTADPGDHVGGCP
jgi:Ca2+-binding RTX toxin-like protein